MLWVLIRNFLLVLTVGQVGHVGVISIALVLSMLLSLVIVHLTFSSMVTNSLSIRNQLRLLYLSFWDV